MASKAQRNVNERIRTQGEEQRRTSAQETANQLAASEAGRVQVGKTDPAFIERILNDDITVEDDPDDDLDEELVTEMSKAHALGYIDDQEYEKKKLELEAHFHRIKPFFPQPEGAGSKFKGEFREIVRGDGNDYPTLTPELARRIDSARGVAQSRLSLSRDGFLIEALTKIQAVTETNPRDDSGGSRVQSAKSKIAGLLKPG